MAARLASHAVGDHDNGGNHVPDGDIGSGQIIATSHDRFPPNGGGLVRESPLFQENLGW